MGAPDQPLTVDRDVDVGARRALLRVRGEIDVASAPIVGDALSDAIAQGCERVVIDLGGVTFIDSSGLQVLVVARSTLEDKGGRLVIAAAADQVLRVFEVSGLTTVFEFEV